jgi:RNA polymerase sigma-70 factor, ECF subfamily
MMSTLSPPASPAAGEVPDGVVVERILAGAKSEFAVLMRRYNQRMFRTVRAIVRQDEEAEDVVQQAWLAAYAALATFRGDSSLGTWLTRIAVNEAIGRIRARNRRGDIYLVDAGEDMATDDPSPEDESVARETARVLEKHIDALPDTYRLVFVMRDVEELTTAETATVLGISEGAVRVRLHRARQLLQGSLSDGLQASLPAAFSFAGERCDRIVAGVLKRI